MNFDRTDHASTPLPDARPCFSVAIHAYNEGETLRDTWGDVRRPVSGIQRTPRYDAVCAVARRAAPPMPFFLRLVDSFRQFLVL